MRLGLRGLSRKALGLRRSTKGGSTEADAHETDGVVQKLDLQTYQNMLTQFTSFKTLRVKGVEGREADPTAMDERAAMCLVLLSMPSRL